ncbi:MAG: alpha/beta hydrolase [Candidatus Nanopelagicaceae bacterium]|nr:alpha/beta hydrolase [Candidatus Nanopelagicaceae bacterium]
MARLTQLRLPDEEFRVSVRGGDLTVARYGSPNGKPILAIHGITSSNRAWQSFAVSLVPHGFTLYAVDLRGRGRSNSLPAPFGMENHARDMVKVLDFLKFERIDVVGHSMGAFVAVALLGMNPERVNKTVLIDGGLRLALPPGFTVEMVLPVVLGPALARLQMSFSSKEDYRNYWRPQAAFIKGWSTAHDEYSDYDLVGTVPSLRPATNPIAVEQDSRDLFEQELIDKTLQNLTSEVLMLRAVRGLQNEENPLYPQGVLDLLLPKYPKVKVVTVEDTNHYDILLDQNGADRCAEIAFGVKS